jgi:hypothetical protein
MWRELSEPDVELTVEEFAPVLALFNRLVRAGVRFPRRLVKGVRRLEASAMGGTEDSDFDAADQWIDLEDADEDNDDPDAENDDPDEDGSDDTEGPDDVSAGQLLDPLPPKPPAPPQVPPSPPLPAPETAAAGVPAFPSIGDHDAFAARVAGDTMEPKYREGDIVIFSPAAPVNDGDDCFIRLVNGDTTFKRVYFETREELPVLRLQPRNETHRARVVPEVDVESFAKAVYRYQRTDEVDAV